MPSKKPKSDTLKLVKSDLPLRNPDDIIDPDKLTELEVRETVYEGSLALQYLLFKHAKDQKPRLNRLGGLIETVEKELYTEDTIKQLEKSQLLKLYSIANERETESIAFLERLHKTVQETENVAKVTRALSESTGNTTDLESVKYKKMIDSGKLRDIKDLLIKNILDNGDK